MRRQLESLHRYIDAWERDVTHPTDELNDPLAAQLQGTPSYLPLLQPRLGYSHYGKHMLSLRVLGLSRDATWVEDGNARGGISWDYGAPEQAFGVVPFPLALLQRAQHCYPLIASLIWDQHAVDQIAARYLTKAQQLRLQVEHAPDARSTVDPSEKSRIRGELIVTCSALGRLETPETVSWLTNALSSGSALLRESALYGFSHMTPSQAVEHTPEPRIGRVREGRNNEQAAGLRSPLPGLLPQFTALLSDASLAVRRMAIAAIRTVGTQHAVETLVALLEQPSEITPAAIDALVALNALSASAPIHALLSGQEHLHEQSPQRQEDEVVVQSATLALQTFWQPGDIEFVRSLLHHPSSRVRAAAAYVALSQRLVELGNELLRCVEHDVAPEVRVEAGYALVGFGDQRVAPLLQSRAALIQPPYIDAFEAHPHLEATEAREMLRLLEEQRNK